MSQNQILPQKELQFLKALISNQYTVLNEMKYSFTNGVPQGSILSPYLFDIYTDMFMSKAREIKLEQMFDHYYFYADDLAVIFEQKYALKIIQGLKGIASKLGLIINNKKCGLMKLHQKNANFDKMAQIEEISYVQNYKYLGIEINNKGQIDSHINHLEKKMNYFKIQFIGILRTIEISNRILLWFTYMKPHFQYILNIFEIQKKKTQNRLILLWKRSLKQWLRLPKATPDKFLEALVGRIQQIAAFQYDKTEYLIEKRFETYESMQMHKLEKSHKIKIRGIKNIPDNIDQLFLLPIRLCKTHKERMSYAHISEMHKNNPVEVLINSITQKYKPERKREQQETINQLINQAGEFISKVKKGKEVKNK